MPSYATPTTPKARQPEKEIEREVPYFKTAKPITFKEYYLGMLQAAGVSIQDEEGTK